MADTFSSCYTWPNEAFPFRVYVDRPELRVFIIENIFHNYKWLHSHSKGIRENDLFLVILGWHHGDWHAKHSRDCIEACGLDLESFIILCNDFSDFMIFSDHGFKCTVVNQNAFLDFNLFKPQDIAKKIYRAVYVGRLTPFKRHELAAEVENLALVAGNLHGGDASVFVPCHTYRNKSQLSPNEVQDIVCSSQVGLILSDIEGACFASSEYLLCGIPVVSTRSRGGRSIWYNDYNSIVCDSTAKDVSRSVSELIDRNPSPIKVRRYHLSLALSFRSSFIRLLADLFEKYKADIDPQEYFEKNYFHKMRQSTKPNFDVLFGQ